MGKRGAPKGNKFAAGNPGGGRPTEYKPEYCSIAKMMCKLGATTADLALAFDVAVSTVHSWQVSFKEFSESCREGKDAFDERVETALAQRAIGYEHKAVKVMQYEGQPVYAEYIEHVPADVNAAKFWLTNRQKKRWVDSSKVTHDTPTDSPLAQLARQLAGTALRPKE